jgi:hypothetical protein
MEYPRLAENSNKSLDNPELTGAIAY